MHDPREHRVGADLLGAHDEATGAVDRAADHAWPRRSFSTGIDSPVTIDSSTALAALDHHAVHRHAVAGADAQAIADMHLLERRPPRHCHRRGYVARVFGARFSSARMAPPVCSRARSSSTWPSKTSTVMTAAAS